MTPAGRRGIRSGGVLVVEGRTELDLSPAPGDLPGAQCGLSDVARAVPLLVDQLPQQLVHDDSSPAVAGLVSGEQLDREGMPALLEPHLLTFAGVERELDVAGFVELGAAAEEPDRLGAGVLRTTGSRRCSRSATPR